MMSACAWNLRKWIIAFFWAENPFTRQDILIVLSARILPHGTALSAWVILQSRPCNSRSDRHTLRIHGQMQFRVDPSFVRLIA